MITNHLPIFLVPLVALHLIPSFASFAHDFATPVPGATLKPIQLGAGLIMLLVAYLVAVRHRKQQRQEVLVPVTVGGDSSVLVPGSPGSARVRRPAAEPKWWSDRPRQAVLERGLAAWESGNLWLSVLFGMGCVPSLTMVLLVDSLIVGSGAPIGMQVMVAIAFVLTMFIVLEAALLSNVFAPAGPSRAEAAPHLVGSARQPDRLHLARHFRGVEPRRGHGPGLEPADDRIRQGLGINLI